MRETLTQEYQVQAERFFDSQSDSYAIMQLDSRSWIWFWNLRTI